MDLHVRAAVAGDVPAAAGVLAEAFGDYPWTRWTVDAERHAERLTALHRLFLAEVAVPYGRVDLGEVEEEPAGVAVRVTGTAVPGEVWSRVGPVAAELAGDRAGAAAEAEAVLDAHRPARPHVVLASLGVAPHRQGRGVGAAVVARGLERADREGLPVHL
ncbi:GNAT family N-acetyltransferase [Kineococcus esterisolvens]|uniref:GNAT family N-acetyltransferase n=1 Tax=unclassified Kineococcus TaxID=2621656 RepID=UPI003D7EB2C3